MQHNFGGRYVLGTLIHASYMAEVYLGCQVGDDGFARICIIKRLLRQNVEDIDLASRFRDEANLGRLLRHGNIVQVYDVAEIDGVTSIVMEWIDGIDLRGFTEGGKRGSGLSISSAVFVAAEAAAALSYAHERTDDKTGERLAIVHRDVSPQNILLSVDGEVKLADFGAALSRARTMHTHTGTVLGKIRYMSPEQIGGSTVDSRSDVFSLAIVLWEILCGKALFDAQDAPSLIIQVRECKIEQKLAELAMVVDRRLVDILRVALARLPEQRYPSAAEFERDLRRFLALTNPGFQRGDIGALVSRATRANRKERQRHIRRLLSRASERPIVRPEVPVAPAPRLPADRVEGGPAAPPASVRPRPGGVELPPVPDNRASGLRLATPARGLKRSILSSIVGMRPSLPVSKPLLSKVSRYSTPWVAQRTSIQRVRRISLVVILLALTSVAAFTYVDSNTAISTARQVADRALRFREQMRRELIRTIDEERAQSH